MNIENEDFCILLLVHHGKFGDRANKKKCHSEEGVYVARGNLNQKPVTASTGDRRAPLAMTPER